MDERELQKLIDEIENNEQLLLHAPAYLKTEILDSIGEADSPDTDKPAAGAAGNTYAAYREDTGLRKRRLLLYSLEVSIMTAAAIALMIIVPFFTGYGSSGPVYSTTGRQRETVLQLPEKASDITRRVVTFGSILMPDRDSYPYPEYDERSTNDL